MTVIWYFSSERLRPAPRCEICGRPIAARDTAGRTEHVCQTCRTTAPERQAA